MIYRLKLTDEAVSLLLSNAQWYAQASQSLEIATAWYDGFLNELESLQTNPLRGTLAAENDFFEFELREIRYGSGKRLTHRALYRVVGNTVEVLTIRHHAQRPLGPTDLEQSRSVVIVQTFLQSADATRDVAISKTPACESSRPIERSDHHPAAGQQAGFQETQN
jgi:plasmid stabilization system protein ParE